MVFKIIYKYIYQYHNSIIVAAALRGHVTHCSIYIWKMTNSHMHLKCLCMPDMLYFPVVLLCCSWTLPQSRYSYWPPRGQHNESLPTKVELSLLRIRGVVSSPIFSSYLVNTYHLQSFTDIVIIRIAVLSTGTNVFDLKFIRYKCQLASTVGLTTLSPVDERKLVASAPQTPPENKTELYMCPTSLVGRAIQVLRIANCTGEYFGIGPTCRAQVFPHFSRSSILQLTAYILVLTFVTQPTGEYALLSCEVRTWRSILQCRLVPVSWWRQLHPSLCTTWISWRDAPKSEPVRFRIFKWYCISLLSNASWLWIQQEAWNWHQRQLD